MQISIVHHYTLFYTQVFFSLACQASASTTRPGVLDQLQPLSPTEQSGGERVSKGRGRGKGKGKGKKRKDGDAASPAVKRRKTNLGKDQPEKSKGKKANPKAKATPKKKSRSQKDKSAEKVVVGKRSAGKGKGAKDTDKHEPTQAQLAIRARNSRKSSAYHQAYKKALAAGLEVEDAKAKGQAVTQGHLEDLFTVCLFFITYPDSNPKRTRTLGLLIIDANNNPNRSQSHLCYVLYGTSLFSGSFSSTLPLTKWSKAYKAADWPTTRALDVWGTVASLLLMILRWQVLRMCVHAM